MCLNCGCGLPDERHGKPANIVMNDLRAAAEANGQTVEESARHIQETVRAASQDRPASPEAGLGYPAGSRGPAERERGTPASES